MEEAKLSFGQKVDQKMDALIEKNMPKGKDATRTNWWLGTCAAMVFTGLYTGIIDWNPAVRTVAHLTGAMAIPAVGSFASSLVMSGIEMAANVGINMYNKKHPERAKEPFKINPKVKDVVKLIAAATVGVAYTYGTLGTEIDQYARSGIFQAHQYIADIGGAAAGIVAFNKLDPSETLASFMNKVNTLSKAIVKPINSLEEKIKENHKDKNELGKSAEVEKEEHVDFVEGPTQEQWLESFKKQYGQNNNVVYRKDESVSKRVVSKDFEVEM